LCVEASPKYSHFIEKIILVISQFIAEDTSGIQRIGENVNWAEKSRIRITMQHRKAILAYSAWKFDRLRRLEMIILRGIAKP
jgi:hypothetical protein